MRHGVDKEARISRIVSRYLDWHRFDDIPLSTALRSFPTAVRLLCLEINIYQRAVALNDE